MKDLCASGLLGMVSGETLTRDYTNQDWAKGKVNLNGVVALASADPMVCY